MTSAPLPSALLRRVCAAPQCIREDAEEAGTQGHRARGLLLPGLPRHPDKVGVNFRSGPNAWVLISYDAWGGLPAGEIPARLYRFFGWENDQAGEQQLQAPRRAHVMVVSVRR